MSFKLDLPACHHLVFGRLLWNLRSFDKPAAAHLLICRTAPGHTNISGQSNGQWMSTLKAPDEVKWVKGEISGSNVILLFFVVVEENTFLWDWFNELKWTEQSSSISHEDRPETSHFNEYQLLLLYRDFISWVHLTAAMQGHQTLKDWKRNRKTGT